MQIVRTVSVLAAFLLQLKASLLSTLVVRYVLIMVVAMERKINGLKVRDSQ